MYPLDIAELDAMLTGTIHDKPTNPLSVDHAHEIMRAHIGVSGSVLRLQRGGIRATQVSGSDQIRCGPDYLMDAAVPGWSVPGTAAWSKGVVTNVKNPSISARPYRCCWRGQLASATSCRSFGSG